MKILKCKVEKNGRRNEMERALAFGVGGKEREKEVKRRANSESWGRRASLDGGLNSVAGL